MLPRTAQLSWPEEDTSYCGQPSERGRLKARSSKVISRRIQYTLVHVLYTSFSPDCQHGFTCDDKHKFLLGVSRFLTVIFAVSELQFYRPQCEFKLASLLQTVLARLISTVNIIYWYCVLIIGVIHWWLCRDHVGTPWLSRWFFIAWACQSSCEISRLAPAIRRSSSGCPSGSSALWTVGIPKMFDTLMQPSSPRRQRSCIAARIPPNAPVHHKAIVIILIIIIISVGSN